MTVRFSPGFAGQRLLGHLLRVTSVLLLMFPAVNFAADDPVDYAKQIKPLLQKRCFACHGALKQEAGLRLDTVVMMAVGGDSGPAIVRKDAAQSLILKRVSATDLSERMPPEQEGEPLSAAQITMLRQWIAAGATAPPDERPEADPKDHWAFQQILRPAVPSLESAWIRNPIDAFLARGHKQQGLIPQSEASRIVLLRRLYLDLIGVPPTAGEIAAFENDKSPEWYDRTAQRLLDDPRHGERWARHWMDIWRYSDWWGLGQQLRNSQYHIWHWRDWIIESLNGDTPYDEMVRLMLAADELHPNDLDKLRATGFLARNYFLFNRPQWMEQTVEHVSKGFLGLTINCAKCHDHKFDPIRQTDFYRMRAFFEPYHARLDVIDGEPDLALDGIPRVFDGRPDEPTYLYIRGDEKNPDQSAVMTPGVPALLEFEKLTIQPVTLPAEAWQPQRRPWIAKASIDAAQKKLDAAEAALTKADAELAGAQATAAKTAATPRPPPPATEKPATEKPATEKPATEKPATEEPAEAGTPLVIEDFATLDKSRWQLFGSGWSHSAGRLDQKLDGPTRSVLRLIAKPPRDFDVTVRFTILGGSMWRSVGFSFDVSEGDPTKDTLPTYHEKNVYVSAFAGGSKVHAAYNDAGKWHYPPGGAVRQTPVKLNQEYTLRVQARDRILNATLNGEPVIACTTPVARRTGLFQLTTFDAVAVFHEVQIRQLDPKVQLRSPESTPSPQETAAVSLPIAQAQQRVAAAAVVMAQAEVTAVSSRAEAWQAVWKEGTADDVRVATHAKAVQAERQLAVETAKHGLATAELNRLQSAADKTAAAETAVKTAQMAVEKATTAAAVEVKATDKIAEFVGAKWTPTRFLNSGSDDPTPEFAPQSTGRRSALAKWITDRRNPLTARVAVNHIWMRHMGKPLVPTVFDFGQKGTRPTHPKLLDWLAAELMDNGWSMKHLHRLIVSSAAYRMSSSVSGGEANADRDSQNDYWWRRVPVRVESQVVRDSLLTLAGTLDTTIGGPPVPRAQQDNSTRRSLYFFHSNNERNLFLTMFDEALVKDCYRREESIVPQQALALTNSALVLDAASKIAGRLSTGMPDDAAFIRAAFRLVVGIHPGDEEVSASVAAIESWRKLPGGSEDSARANFVWALINHNDFVTMR